jgi:DNA-binding SARP family transcriptional activator
MRYRLLGPVEATADDGGPLRVAPPRRRAILAYLLLHAGQPVTGGELIEAVWGEEPPPATRESLQAHISRLRGELPAGAIVMSYDVALST